MGRSAGQRTIEKTQQALREGPPAVVVFKRGGDFVNLECGNVDDLGELLASSWQVVQPEQGRRQPQPTPLSPPAAHDPA